MYFAKQILKKTTYVYARDKSSLNYLMNEGIKADYCDDSVFLFNHSEMPEGITIDNQWKYVGIIPNRHLLDNYSKEVLFDEYLNAIYYLNLKGYRIIIFPHSFISDKKFLEELEALIQKDQSIPKEAYVFVHKQLSLSNVNYLYSKLEFIISSRFHSIVLNYCNKKPAIIIGWSEKYFELAEQFGQSTYILEPGKKDIQIIIGNLINNKTLLTKHISEVLENKRKQCAKTLKEILPLIDL